MLHSTLLQAAYEATEGMDTLTDIIEALERLVDNLKQEQQSETDHKKWCEKELKETKDKRDDHSSIIEDIKAALANLGEVVAEKETQLDTNGQDIDAEDAAWDGLVGIRDGEKEEYEHDHEEHVEAIAALNEALDILAKFYASKKGAAALLQAGEEPDVSSGSSVVGMMSDTRTEFAEGKKHLEEEEAEAQKTFEEDKQTHIQTASDLQEEKDTLTVEKQTAESSIETNKEDKVSHEGEVKSANVYLGRLGRSCSPLLEHFDERKTLRQEEKKALKDAIKVIKDAN